MLLMPQMQKYCICINYFCVAFSGTWQDSGRQKLKILKLCNAWKQQHEQSNPPLLLNTCIHAGSIVITLML